MSRPNGLSRAYASVSVIAVMGLLVGCSQPATYATVDLGGTYAANGPQAYSAASGLPVYQSTQGYTNPYGAGVAPPAQTQLVYLDAPTNQVASLAPVYGGGYGQPVQQSYPAFGPVVQGETLTDETILRSDGFIDIGNYGGTQTASLAPGAGSISLGAMDAAPQYTPAPQTFGAPQYVPAPPAMVEAAPMAEPVPYEEPLTVIEATPLPAPEFAAAPVQVAPVQATPAPVAEILLAPVPETLPVAAPTTVALDYAEVADDSYGAVVDQGAMLETPVYTPTVNAIQSAPLDMLEAPAQDFAGWQQPARDDVDAVSDYFGLRESQTDGTVQQAALQTAIPPLPAAPSFGAPAPAATAPGLTLPIASQEYVRPYEGLRPGFYPPYDFGPAGDALSRAPLPQAGPQVAAIQPSAPVDQRFTPVASTNSYIEMPLEQASIVIVDGAAFERNHTVQPGDTLYSIARLHGVAPQSIAETNGIDLGGTIYPGNTLAIPAGNQVSTGPETLGDAPIVVLKTAQVDIEQATGSTYTRDLTGQSVEMLDLAELAQMYEDRETGFGTMPIISAEAGNALRGQTDMTPTERIVVPQGSMAATVPVMQAPVRAMPAYTPAPMPVARTSAGYAWPVHGEVYRLSDGQIEIEAPFGASVSAAASGRVVHVENGPRGFLVVIEHDDGWRSLTLGLTGAMVSPGQRVMEGTPLGITGMDRVRFELRDSNANIAETLGVLRS